jgi:hypothetical protein
MIAVSIASFVSGTILGAWLFKLSERSASSPVNTGAPAGSGLDSCGNEF